MSIFGIGGMELVLIFVIALIVAGPKRMALWAYTLGQWTAKLRVMWEEVAVSLQEEFKQSGIDVEVPRTPPTRADLQRGLQDYGRQVMQEAGNPQEEIKKLQDEVRGVGQTAREEMQEIDRTVKAATKPQNGTQPRQQPDTRSSDKTDDSDDSSNSTSFGSWGKGS